MTAVHPATAWTGDGRLERPARRIVSLLPSATEIVCALDLEARLVAVTHECDFPADAVAGLPRVTANLLRPEVSRSADIDAAVRAAMTDGHGIYALDDGLLADLQADLILTQELCRVCAVAYPTVLEAARTAGGDGGPMVVSLEPHSVADVLATIGHVARLAGVPDAGERLVGDLERRLASLERAADPRRVALVEWLDPLFAPGHWVPEQVELAGGRSVIGQAGERSREATWEALAETQPQVVVLGLCGFDLPRTLAEWTAFEVPDALARTAAWRDGEVWAIDGSAYVSRPGPRLVDGVEVLAAILAGRPDERAVRLPTS
ncbi:MAG: iron complex transport system substrate-binding protein [Chloroflexota bacterium]|jgi:iron complex transport system substrate-binding protein|nr:iron complex transport system substrate-binding protein [Chloroflexota bacterium]